MMATTMPDVRTDESEGPEADLTPEGPTSSPLSRRLVAAAWLAPCVALLVISASLAPRQAGYGTASQLGLPDCSALVESGYPCPTCGMTTSMAAMAEGRVGLAWRAQPFGIVMFVATAGWAAAAACQLATGRDILARARLRWWYALVAVGGCLAGWGWVLLSGVIRGAWPIQ